MGIHDGIEGLCSGNVGVRISKNVKLDFYKDTKF